MTPSSTPRAGRQDRSSTPPSPSEAARRPLTVIVVVVALVALLGGSVFIAVSGLRSDAPAGDAEGAPDSSLAAGRTWEATIHTSVGDIAVTLDGENAPQATASFLHLAETSFYEGTACHRLVPQWFLQCGDPTGTGTGGPGYQFGPIENAPPDDLYRAGTLAMARVGDDGMSMGSQFFFVYADVPLPADSAGGYSVFGHVTEGIELLQQVGAAGTADGSARPALDVIIEGVTIS